MSGREVDLLNLVGEALNKRADALLEGRLFNLFDALSIREREVIHSRVIATLLSPDSLHGMGVVPYQMFMRKLSEEFPSLELLSKNRGSSGKVCISTEHYIGPIPEDYESGGSIDVLIRDGQLTIAVENKIYAEDQPKQLFRYANWLKQRGGSTLLIYLTLDGHRPSENSVCGKVCEFDLSRGGDLPMYIRLSYRFVSDWISSLFGTDKVELPANSPSRMFLEQYLTTVQSMLNDNEDETMIKALNGYLAEAESIANEFPKARKRAIENMISRPLGMDGKMFESFARGNAPSHNPCKIYEKGKMAVCLSWFGVELYSNPVVGIAFSDATNKAEREKLGEVLRQTFVEPAIELPLWRHCESSEWWPVYYKSDMTVSGRFLDDDKKVLQMGKDVKMIFDCLRTVVDKVGDGEESFT